MSKEPIIIPAYRITENGSVLVSRELEIPTDSEPLTITLPTNVGPVSFKESGDLSEILLPLHR